MHSDEVFFSSVARHLQEKGRVALATVVETKGSGPSKVGRRFLIFDDGSFEGSIGGGPFEALVIADSAALFRDGGPERLLKWYDFFEREVASEAPREPTNMICGGSARVYVERLQAQPALVILGGGHVGLALARFGREMGYDVLVADDRAEYAAADRFPEGVAAVRTDRDYRLPEGTLPPGRDRYVAVVSRCWETDLAALRHWVKPDAAPVRYLGLIGSARKIRSVFDRLREEGVPPEKLRIVRAPIGLQVGAVTPQEIAIAILAEMTAVRRHASAGAFAPEESLTE